MSRSAVDLAIQVIQANPKALICAASGGTPTRFYELLAQSCTEKVTSDRALRVIKLDEWGGLPKDDPGSCEAYLQRWVVQPLGILPENYTRFDDQTKTPVIECQRVRKWLAENGPIDLCILGLGTNGHLALNEPGDCLYPCAHVAQLAETSTNHPMLASSLIKPTFGMTLGVAELLLSRRIILLVSGQNKQAPMKHFMSQRIATTFPGSLLWLHPNVTVFCDQEAVDGLEIPLSS